MAADQPAEEAAEEAAEQADFVLFKVEVKMKFSDWFRLAAVGAVLAYLISCLPWWFLSLAWAINSFVVLPFLCFLSYRAPRAPINTDDFR